MRLKIESLMSTTEFWLEQICHLSVLTAPSRHPHVVNVRSGNAAAAAGSGIINLPITDHRNDFSLSDAQTESNREEEPILEKNISTTNDRSMQEDLSNGLQAAAPNNCINGNKILSTSDTISYTKTHKFSNENESKMCPRSKAKIVQSDNPWYIDTGQYNMSGNKSPDSCDL